MAWRIVKQPNGKFARFSDIVDDFTAMDMTEPEVYSLCRVHLGIKDAERKVQAGMEDWRPWTTGAVKGNGTERWEDSLNTIENVHGRQVAEERRLVGIARRP